MPAEFSTAPHLIIEALAGTGKTFVVKSGTDEMHWMPRPKGIVMSEEQEAIIAAMKADGSPGDMHLTSFSTDATEQLKKKLPEGCTASSTYGMGYACARWSGIGGTKSDFKYERLFNDLMGGQWEGERKYPGLKKVAVDLCEKGRLGLKKQLTQPELEDLAEYYGMELPCDAGHVTKTVNKLLEMGLLHDDAFDYTDMVWLPVMKNLIQKKYDHLVVDEFQDMGIAQQEICFRIARRIIAIGDQNQAIYGFIGADTTATENFCKALGRTGRGVRTLPLTYTRRCFQKIVERANQIVPGLKALPDAGIGEVEEGYCRGQEERMEINDMVICPTNAPMVSLLFKLVKKGKKAYVRKSEVVNQMRSYVSEFTKGIEELRTAIKRNVDRLKAAKPSRSSRASLDKFQCLLELAQQSTTTSDIGRALSTLFVDDNKPNTIRLSSVHRSKGLEAGRVFFWEWNLCGKWAEQPWEKQQARNLEYVGITRAKHTLVLCRAEAL